ncbi:MAG: hypothetical protein IT288_10410 [Bdellovibrionales bacterium]|nr:hypothetical protein [Bdellovibrionales bacterium]
MDAHRLVRYFLISVCWWGGLPVALGASSYQPQKIKITSENPRKLQVKIWQKKVFPELIGGVCESGGYFTECFQVPAEKCQAEARMQIESCKAKLRMPPTFKSETEALDWSRKLGECLGGKLEHKLKPWQRDQAKCSSVEAWL